MAQDANLVLSQTMKCSLLVSAKLPAIQKFGCDEAQSADGCLEKTDRAFAEAVENDESQKERCDYFASFIRDAAQKESFESVCMLFHVC